MGCSSCGRGGRTAQTRGQLWVLTLPSGKKKTYASEGDAQRAQKRLGGEITLKNKNAR